MAATETTQAPKILHLSLLLGAALRDSDGSRLGRVDDAIVRLEGSGYPPLTGFLVTVAGRQSYLAGRMPKRMYADPSSPLAGLI